MYVATFSLSWLKKSLSFPTGGFVRVYLAVGAGGELILGGLERRWPRGLFSQEANSNVRR